MPSTLAKPTGCSVSRWAKPPQIFKKFTVKVKTAELAI
jgi:hypothetical protein